MYWDRKILEWIEHHSVRLSDGESLEQQTTHDGRQPSSHGNIAWVLGLWDPAREEGDTYRKVRTMTAAGPERRAESEEHVLPVEEPTGLEVQR